MNLTQTIKGKEYKVISIDGGHRLKGKLYSMGLIKGGSFKILNVSSSGPVALWVRGSKIALGFSMAQKIMVKEKKGLYLHL